MLEIGELAEDKFRAMFKLTYNGDAFLVLHTWIQANPLHGVVQFPPSPRLRSRVLAADKSLVVPMELCISNLRLRGIAALVVDMSKGVTLCFKNDPLESIQVSSTFDNVELISTFLQQQIEKQLRKLFVEDMPALIHNLSVYKLQQHASNAYLDVQLIAPDGTPLGPASRTMESGNVKSIVSSGPSRWIGGDVLTIRSASQISSIRPMSWNPSALDRIEDEIPPVERRPHPVLRRQSTRWVGNEPWEALYRDREEDLAPQEVTFNKNLADLVGRKRSGSFGSQSRLSPLDARPKAEKGLLRVLDEVSSILSVSRWNPQTSYFSSFARFPPSPTDYMDDNSSIGPDDSASGMGIRAFRAPQLPIPPSSDFAPKSVASSHTFGKTVARSVASSHTTVDRALEVYHQLPPFVPPSLPLPKVIPLQEVDGVKTSIVGDEKIVFLEPTADTMCLDSSAKPARMLHLLQESQLTLSPYTRTPHNCAFRTQERTWSDDASMVRSKSGGFSPVPSMRSIKSTSPMQKGGRTIRRLKMTGKRVDGVGLVPSSNNLEAASPRSTSASFVSSKSM